MKREQLVTILGTIQRGYVLTSGQYTNFIQPTLFERVEIADRLIDSAHVLIQQTGLDDVDLDALKLIMGQLHELCPSSLLSDCEAMAVYAANEQGLDRIERWTLHYLYKFFCTTPDADDAESFLFHVSGLLRLALKEWKHPDCVRYQRSTDNPNIDFQP